MIKITKSELEKHESFEKIPKKHIAINIIKTIGLVIGVILIVFSTFIIVLSYAIEYIAEDLPNPDVISFTAFTLGWILFSIGFASTIGVSILTLPKASKVSSYLDKYFKNYEKPDKSIRFNSLPLSRVIASIFLLVLGFTDLFIITGAISHHQPPYGNALFLGGPSFFYTAGFFPLLLGIGLIVYVLLDTYKGNFARSNNNLYFHEFRKNSILITKIDKGEIELIGYQNNKLGPKYLWVILLTPFIMIFSFIEGYYILNAPLLTTPIQGILLIFSGIMECFALYFLVFRQQNYLKIITKRNIYDMWFSPFKKYFGKNNEKTEEINEIFDPSQNRENKKITEFMDNNKISSTHRNYINLLLSIFFMISGIIMLVLYFSVGIFGNLYTMFSIIFGIILLIKAFSKDFGNKNGDYIDFDKSNNSLRFYRKYKNIFLNKFHNIFAFNIKEARIENRFRRLNFFDFLIIPILLIFSTIETVQSWAISSTPITIIDSIITTIFLILVYFLIFIYLCVPMNNLLFRTQTVKSFIPVTLKTENFNMFKGILSKDLRSTLFLRILFMLLIILLSTIGMLIYLNFYFL